MTSELAAWDEWKTLCALGRCSDQTKSQLRAWIAARFHDFLRRYAHRTNVAPANIHSLQPSDPWHLFEIHLTINQNRAGKRYKDWLFARPVDRAGDSLAAVESGVRLLLRDVVREYLRNECSPPHVRSMNQPLRGCEPLTLADLLPGDSDPFAAVQQNEFASQARDQAHAIWDTLTQRERVALLARERGLVFASDDVETAAGCAKSMIHQGYRDLVLNLFARLRAEYQDDDPASVTTLTLLTLRELKQLAVIWGKSEKRCAPLYLYKVPETSP